MPPRSRQRLPQPRRRAGFSNRFQAASLLCNGRVMAVIRRLTVETRIRISVGPLANSIASLTFFKLAITAVTRLVQSSPALGKLLFDEEIACVDSPHPTCLLRDLNGSCSFSSAVDDSGQTHHAP
jgi:hypothetical protein